MSKDESLLRNVWYMACASEDVLPGKIKQVVISGEPIAFFRDSQGRVAAVRDICPHRGIPLSYGQVIDGQIECPYHGWMFNHEGVCTEIPSLYQGQDLDPRKIKVKKYHTEEYQDNIWVFIGDKDFDLSLAPQIPKISFWPSNRKPNYREVVIFPCHIDHAVIGLMDPAHGPYVHQSWFWRSKKSIIEKRKKFAPVPFGFQMVRHQPSSNSKAYKILGDGRTTEITFSLPSVRVEHIQVGKFNFVSYTALSPIDDKSTRVHQLTYWDMPWLSAIKPLVTGFAHKFLHQDLTAVAKQQDGLRYDPTLMLIKDADQQAKWYFGLKEEWFKHLSERRTFQNPVKEMELRWRS